MDKMDYKQLKTLVTQKGQSANKRFDRISASRNMSHLATNAVKRSGGRFSVAGKNKEQLIIEAKRIQAFNKSSTGTVSGATKQAKSYTGSKKKTTKKKKKSLKTIKQDIIKKQKQIEKERGKEEAKKYRRRAEARYKTIQKKRREEREQQKAVKQSKPSGEERSGELESLDDIISKADTEIENLQEEVNHIRSNAILDQARMGDEKLISTRSREQQEVMPDISEEWSKKFI